MRITKDEAFILAQALKQAEFAESWQTEQEIIAQKEALDSLQKRLAIYSRDARRQGRTSLNYKSDILKRFVKNSK